MAPGGAARGLQTHFAGGLVVAQAEKARLAQDAGVVSLVVAHLRHEHGPSTCGGRPGGRASTNGEVSRAAGRAFARAARASVRCSPSRLAGVAQRARRRSSRRAARRSDRAPRPSARSSRRRRTPARARAPTLRQSGVRLPATYGASTRSSRTPSSLPRARANSFFAAPCRSRHRLAAPHDRAATCRHQRLERLSRRSEKGATSAALAFARRSTRRTPSSSPRHCVRGSPPDSACMRPCSA